MLNETTVEEERETQGREELYKKEIDGREGLYELAQLSQAGYLPLESKAKEPEEEVKCFHMVKS